MTPKQHETEVDNTRSQKPARTGLPRLWPGRLGWRLALGFAILVILMLVTLAFTSLQIRSMVEMNQQFATQDIQRLLRVQSLSLNTEGAGNALLRLMHAKRAQRVEEYARVDERNRLIDRTIAALNQTLMDAEQEQTLARLVEIRAVYFEAFIATVDQIEADDPKAAQQAYTEQVQPALRQMLIESNALIWRERDRIEQQSLEAQHLQEQVGFWVAVASLLAVALSVWLALRTTRSVVQPLGQIEAAAKRIARGDYSQPVPTTSAEEMDRVGQALNSMTQAIAARERDIERLAYSDSLTCLPNRTRLLEQKVGAANDADCLALIDLLRLKTINETLGFQTGDMVIAELGARIERVVSDAAQQGQIDARPIVARLSGGTFAVLFRAIHRDRVEQLRQQIEQTSALPVHCSGHNVDLSLGKEQVRLGVEEE